jgi:hypothetical protein
VLGLGGGQGGPQGPPGVVGGVPGASALSLGLLPLGGLGAGQGGPQGPVGVVGGMPGLGAVQGGPQGPLGGCSGLFVSSVASTGASLPAPGFGGILGVVSSAGSGSASSVADASLLSARVDSLEDSIASLQSVHCNFMKDMKGNFVMQVCVGISDVCFC